ncbi:extracellular solute-binding protein [Sulfitobacter mediterraneus]|uniref:extracellular solute-binding protein n=2 Tax=Sulfitobacter mediterraneus TaxID=83219 RepID=UPI001931EB2C|nr:extracellular solute-binding protein [Sulfitobacter mediterraneus]MBM1310968.1 extracellular solute-binding protein [Sulfitobacter mediterraneus]MBM1314851.1 extracellular solute-binding protein [Sulfitobacter mediterraneus]MBM1323211.1 extracellular solute-binding protein [Sulfitobacter mediterraneus]MBM1327123.1 extracellular solute-binding protein [Sulfitobacter mediterraneus]MBM1398470.1 extracellular solute-binding protein [Sulfitobacter mediterraneus]
MIHFGRTALVGAFSMAIAMPALAQDKTEISVSRFFGSCEADYGDVTDASEGRGECGIVTALINEFNATSDKYVAKEEIVEWPGYDQLTARLRNGEPPTISVMHQSILSDYASRDLLMPLGEALEKAGVDLADITDAAREGVTKSGDIYAMPFDTLGWLWHTNTNLMAQADLMQADGTPVMPSSPDEMLAQARQFKEATGKPYLCESSVGGAQGYARTLFTLLYQQDHAFFADPAKIDLSADATRNYIDLFQTLYSEGLSSTNYDYSAATAAFPQGECGIYIMGTWLIDSYQKASTEDGALKNGYYVQPFPQLFGQDGLWSDGHSWVIPRQELSAEQHEAAIAFLTFLWDNNFEWARTGHLPVRKSIIESDAFVALPARERLDRVAAHGKAFPAAVKRQFTVTDVVGEEMQAAVNSQKSADDAIAAAEKRINDMLARAN